MIYSFDANILSAVKVGSPTPTNAVLSATGVTYLSGDSVTVNSSQVGVVSLSTNNVGLAFSTLNFSIGTTVQTASTFNISAYPTVTINALGSVFNVPATLHNTDMALVNTDGTYSTFTFLSSVATVPTSAFSVTYNVATPETRRKYLLGYI